MGNGTRRACRPARNRESSTGVRLIRIRTPCQTDALAILHPAVLHKDVPTPLVPYGAAFTPGDKVDIPSMDLPAGTPKWMYDDDGGAARKASPAPAKRRNITITVPTGVIP